MAELLLTQHMGRKIPIRWLSISRLAVMRLGSSFEYDRRRRHRRSEEIQSSRSRRCGFSATGMNGLSCRKTRSTPRIIPNPSIWSATLTKANPEPLKYRLLDDPVSAYADRRHDYRRSCDRFRIKVIFIFAVNSYHEPDRQSAIKEARTPRVCWAKMFWSRLGLRYRNLSRRRCLYLRRRNRSS